MHRFRLAAGLLIALLLAWPQSAAACSPGDSPFTFYLEYADVVAVGEVIEAGPDTLTLRVDEYWKGAAFSEELSVDNHGYSICSDEHHPGPLVTKGTRIVALLGDAPGHSEADWGFAPGHYVVVDAPPDQAGTSSHYQYDVTTPLDVVKRDVREAMGEFHPHMPVPAAPWLAGIVALSLSAACALGLYLKYRRLEAPAGPSRD